MNVWGCGAFNNEAAVAWLDQLKTRGAAHVYATIDSALGPQKLSAEEGARVVAAAAIVAGLHNPQFAARLPQHARDWPRRQELVIDAGLLGACNGTLATVTAEGSALHTFWRERDELAAWQQYIADVQTSFGFAPHPQSAAGVPMAVSRRLQRPFDARWSLATRLQLLIAMAGILLVIGAVFGALDTAVLADSPAPANPEEVPVTFPGFVSAMAMLFYLPVQLAAIVLFFIWLYRTHISAQRLGAFGFRYSPALAVGSFFIPIINLYRPHSVMQDAYRASNPQQVGGEPQAWMYGRPNYLIVLWWVLYLGANILYLIIDAARGEEAAESLLLGWHDFGMWLAIAIECGVMILIIRSIQQRQVARHAALARAAAGSSLNADGYVTSLAEAFYRQYPGGKVPPPQERPLATSGALPMEAPLPTARALPRIRADHLRKEKFSYMGAWLAYIVGLCLFLAYSHAGINALPGIPFAVMGTILYLIALSRTFFGEQHAEKWTCFGLAILLVAAGVAIMIGTRVYRDPASLTLYLLFIALHVWLLSILVRDARRWRA